MFSVELGKKWNHGRWVYLSTNWINECADPLLYRSEEVFQNKSFLSAVGFLSVLNKCCRD
jgi:hypothetical protein